MHIEFEPGIAAFVGANGSGKSNLVDAIRWSLGEQRPRELRAQRSEDIIHAADRRAVGLAEVGLTLENDHCETPERWSELTLCRRLYRSGESEYWLNGARARLKDVTSALQDLSIDPNQSLIVTQGMADSLLAASPIERRQIIERVGGLAGIRSSSEDARQKLATVTRNLETAELVLAEMEPRLRLLRRQARAVQDRAEAESQLKQALIQWHAATLHDLGTRQDAMQKESDRCAGTRASQAEALRREEQASSASVSRERQWYEALNEASEDLRRLERQRDTARLERQQINESINQTRRDIDSLEERSHRLATQMALSKTRLQEILTDHERQTEKLKTLQVQRESHLETSCRLQDALASMDSEAERERATSDDLRRQLRTLDDQLARSQRQIKVDEERVEQVTALRHSHERELRAIEQELSRVKARRALVEEQERMLEARGLSAKEQSRLMHLRLQRVERLCHRQLSLLAAIDGQLGLIVREVRQLENALGATLITKIKVRQGSETVVASALDVWSSAVDIAGSSIRLHAWDPASFYAWRDTLRGPSKTEIEWLDSHVSNFPKALVNPLAATALVSDPDGAKRMWEHLSREPGSRVGTLPLQVVSSNGVCYSSVGVRAHPRSARPEQYLRLQHRRDQLLRRQRVGKQRLGRLDLSRQEIAGLYESTLNQMASLDQELQGARNEKNLLVQAQRRETRTGEDLRKIIEHDQQTLAEVRRSVSSAAETVHLLEAEVAETVKRHTKATKSFDDVIGRRTTAQQAMTEAVARTADTTAACDALRVEQSALEKQRDEMERSLRAASSELAEIESNHEHLSKCLQPLIETSEQKDEQCKRLDTLVAEREGTVDHLRRNRPPESHSEDSLRRLREDLSRTIATHERFLAELAQLDAQRATWLEELWADLQLTPDQLPTTPSLPISRDDLRRLRSKASAYSEVDESVVQEFNELQRRQSDLSQEVADLSDAASNLFFILNAAEAEIKTRFADAFHAVNEEFGVAFRAMFGGGEALLERSDDDNGIEIRIELPGKRRRTSTSFSGGERTLIAASLLFSILRTRPSPFCVLDEVDAALDERNVDRYLAVLRDLSRETQMLVVTHNRATMAAADALYGLTMDETGASSVLSLRLEAYDQAM